MSDTGRYFAGRQRVYGGREVLDALGRIERLLAAILDAELRRLADEEGSDE